MRAMTPEERAVWMAGLSEEQLVIVYAPPGVRFTLVLVAHTKRELLTYKMVAAERLKILESLARCTDLLPERAIACIEPSCDTALKMVAEADANLDAIGDFDVFSEFVRLNPSLLAALRAISPAAARAA
jgi:hypothetical protein